MIGLNFHKGFRLNLLFPLPYRIFFLSGLGVLGWATNLHGLDALGIDAISALELRTEGYSPRASAVMQRPVLYPHSTAAVLFKSIYRVFMTYTAWWVSSWIVYRVVTQGDSILVDTYGYIPAVTSAVVFLILLCPFNICFKTEREKFTQAIRRCFFSSAATPILFSDVVFADIGTSFAKVLGDIWLSLCMITPGNSMLVPPLQEGYSRWILPTLMSLPYFARFRQCAIEYNLPSNQSRRPLFNALKYATAFPVIYLSAAQRLVVEDLIREKGDHVANEPWHGEHRLFRLWLLAVFINSLYSFWWDVTNDWGLDLLKPKSALTPDRQPQRPFLLPHLHSGTPLITRESIDSIREEDRHHSFRSNSSRQPYGLRPILLFPLPTYPILIFINLLLRMTWSIKLSSHLHMARDGSVTMFWLEVAEIVRRWLWVFIRVEWEVIKKSQEGQPVVEASNRSEGDVEYELISSPLGISLGRA